jgi:hypothetical protein
VRRDIWVLKTRCRDEDGTSSENAIVYNMGRLVVFLIIHLIPQLPKGRNAPEL